MVKMYKTTSHGYDQFTVAHYVAGKRQLKQFSDFSEAEQFARTCVGKINAGEILGLKLTNEEAADYANAVTALKPTGKKLSVAAMEYLESWKILKGRSLLPAVEFYVRHFPRDVVPVTVKTTVEQFLESKGKDGLSDLYLKDLRLRLGKLSEFSNHFGDTYIQNITQTELDDWLRELKVSGRTRNNLRNSIVTLFHYAKSRGFLPRERLTEADGLARAKETKGEIGIFKVEEMSKLLTACDADLLPFVAIGGFAGLRHFEILRLQWHEVRLDEKHILVAANKAKTASRRIVPIHPNLAQWLAPYKKSKGSVCPFAFMHRPLEDLCETADIKWTKNGLRHSYGSYRLAQTKNAAEVSLEMGNSPRTVFVHYRELVTPKQAEAWFSITPKH